VANEESIEPVQGVRIWIEQGAVDLKAVESSSGDPVELAAHEVETVITALQSLLAKLRLES
jgi:hypothetical protein